MVHGHEWRVQVELNYVTSVAELEAHGGMLYDFAKISKVFAHLDHDDLNEYVHFPTAEMISIYVGKLVARELMIDPGSVLVTVWEDEESSVTTIILSNNGEEYDED
jgi:6-pyruvoyl-tetrahydropterin synthase